MVGNLLLVSSLGITLALRRIGQVSVELDEFAVSCDTNIQSYGSYENAFLKYGNLMALSDENVPDPCL